MWRTGVRYLVRSNAEHKDTHIREPKSRGQTGVAHMRPSSRAQNVGKPGIRTAVACFRPSPIASLIPCPFLVTCCRTGRYSSIPNREIRRNANAFLVEKKQSTDTSRGCSNRYHCPKRQGSFGYPYEYPDDIYLSGQGMVDTAKKRVIFGQPRSEKKRIPVIFISTMVVFSRFHPLLLFGAVTLCFFQVVDAASIG